LKEPLFEKKKNKNKRNKNTNLIYLHIYEGQNYRRHPALRETKLASNTESDPNHM